MLVNCKHCERAFNQVGPEKLCPACRDTYIRLFQYLAENPQTGLDKIEEDLNISVEEVRSFLRHGRFVAFENLSRQLLACLRCGGAPDRGELCQNCFKALMGELVDELDHDKEGSDPGQETALGR